VKNTAKAAVNAAKQAATQAVKEAIRRELGPFQGPARKAEKAVVNALHKGVGKIFGQGDYVVHSNSLIQGGSVAPVFSNSQHGVRIRDREFVGTVVSGQLYGGSTLFTNQSYRINPANAALFPWLSRIAPLFDQWQPHGLVIEYVSTSSEYNGTSQALGVVIAATDYDVNDAPAVSRLVMENMAYSISAKASANILHGIECSPAERPTKLLYTQTATHGSRAELADLGTFQLATQGMSAQGVTLGELYVTYDIEFFKKQMVLLESGDNVPFFQQEHDAPTTTANNWFDLLQGGTPQSSGVLAGCFFEETTTTGVWDLCLPAEITEGFFLLVFVYGSPDAYDHQQNDFLIEADSINVHCHSNFGGQWKTSGGETTKQMTAAVVFEVLSGGGRLRAVNPPTNVSGTGRVCITQINPEFDLY
jgi:hypothetical protein